MLSYANASVLYVSKKLGNPLYSGFHFEEDGNCNGPLPSLDLALQKVGQMRRAGNTQPVCVKLLDKEYDLDSCLEIVEQTSGLHNNALASDITIEPFGKEKVLISGGKKLVGFIDDEFNGCMSDDFNTALALSNLFACCKGIKKYLAEKDGAAVAFANQLRKTYSLLGLFKKDAAQYVAEYESKQKANIPEEVQAIAKERWAARVARDWAKSDELRAKLSEMGYAVKDSKEGYELSKI
jgi:cysteinyl-tRNA synthetase